MQNNGTHSVQIIVPQRASIIFDANQAYQAYSLPKIHYKTHIKEIPQVQKGPSMHQQQQVVKFEDSNHKKKAEGNIFKEWNVNYKEDLYKRLASNKELKVSDNSNVLDNIKSISKLPPKKKTRFHKTKFKIVKNNQNQEVLENTLCNYINQNLILKADKNTSQKDYDDKAPFFIPSLAFAEELNEDKLNFKQKYGFDDKVLRRNKLILEEVILLRMQNREKNRKKNKLINQLTEKPQTQPQQQQQQ